MPRLESAVREDPANATASLYLGIAYQQLGRYDDALETLKKGLPRAGAMQALFAYNLGNACFAKGSMAFAEQYYSQAISLDVSYASAYLNRANARIRSGKLADAAEDYRTFLSAVPETPKRPEIEKMLAIIQESFEAEEKRKVEAELAVRAEEDRRRKLLDEVSASLQAAAEDTRGLSAGAENVMQYDGEFELE